MANSDLTCPAFDERDGFVFLPDPVQFDNTDIILNGTSCAVCWLAGWLAVIVCLLY